MTTANQDTNKNDPMMKELTTKCPMCKNKGVRAFRPFCSKRCKSVDLGNWVTGAYAIPGGDADVSENPQPDEDNNSIQ